MEAHKKVEPVIILMWTHDSKEYIVTHRTDWPYAQKSEVEAAAAPYKDVGVYNDTRILIHHRSFGRNVDEKTFDAIQVWQLKDSKLIHLWNIPIEGT